MTGDINIPTNLKGNGEPLSPNPAESKQPEPANKYELLSPDVVSNIEETLKAPDSHLKAAAVLVYAVDPDESAFAFSEQLNQIFRDAECIVVEGSPPQNIRQIPGVSCFLCGNAAANAGLWRAAVMILGATKSHPQIEMIPRYSESFKPIMGAQKLPSEMKAVRNLFQAQQDPEFTNSVFLIMIRKK